MSYDAVPMPALAALLLVLQIPVPTHRPSVVKPTPVPTGPFVTLDRIAAVVGDDVVLDSEVNRLVAVELLPRRLGEADAAYRDRVLSDRVDELLRDQQLRRTGGVEPEAREVETRLTALEQRWQNEKGEPFTAVLERAHVTRVEVSGWIKRGLALETFARERLSPTIKITEAELKATYDGPFRTEAAEHGVTALPPLAEVQDEVRELVRERKLNAEIERWMEELRQKTRIVVYRRGPTSSR